jgi:hypothetical protein
MREQATALAIGVARDACCQQVAAWGCRALCHLLTPPCVFDEAAGDFNRAEPRKAAVE